MISRTLRPSMCDVWFPPPVPKTDAGRDFLILLF